MICIKMPVLTEDLYIVQKGDFSITYYVCDSYTWRKAKHIQKRQTTFSSERMFRKVYDRKGSAEEISGRQFQGAWPQAELIGGKPPVVK
jgi:hypothetical protein